MRSNQWEKAMKSYAGSVWWPNLSSASNGSWHLSLAVDTRMPHEKDGLSHHKRSALADVVCKLATWVPGSTLIMTLMVSPSMIRGEVISRKHGTFIAALQSGRFWCWAPGSVGPLRSNEEHCQPSYPEPHIEPIAVLPVHYETTIGASLESELHRLETSSWSWWARTSYCTTRSRFVTGLRIRVIKSARDDMVLWHRLARHPLPILPLRRYWQTSVPFPQTKKTRGYVLCTSIMSGYQPMIQTIPHTGSTRKGKPTRRMIQRRMRTVVWRRRPFPKD